MGIPAVTGMTSTPTPVDTMTLQLLSPQNFVVLVNQVYGVWHFFRSFACFILKHFINFSLDSTATTPTGCTNNNTVWDEDGFTCSSWYDDHPETCGLYDTANFMS